MQNALSVVMPQHMAIITGEATLHPYLSMACAAEPELLMRTGGESRISNFMLWQTAYTELFFAKTLWLDFFAPVRDQALEWFRTRTRDRRFGASSSRLAC